jgi:hypothetical protein
MGCAVEMFGGGIAERKVEFKKKTKREASEEIKLTDGHNIGDLCSSQSIFFLTFVKSLKPLLLLYYTRSTGSIAEKGQMSKMLVVTRDS